MSGPARRAMVIGVGLIGGSIGLALRRAGWEVLGRDASSTTLDTALEKLSVREVDAIPVVDPGTRRLLGVLTRERMMQAYGEALSADG